MYLGIFLTMLCDPDVCGVGEEEQEEGGIFGGGGSDDIYLTSVQPTQPQSSFNDRPVLPKDWMLICRNRSRIVAAMPVSHANTPASCLLDIMDQCYPAIWLGKRKRGGGVVAVGVGVYNQSAES